MIQSPTFKNTFLQSKVAEGLRDEDLQAAILESQGSLTNFKKLAIDFCVDLIVCANQVAINRFISEIGF